jgi:hypothetical protein
MSYIDTFDHKHVGWFAGLPIYLSLESVIGDGNADFSVDRGALILGGGCGEHPALIFKRCDCLVIRFLLHAECDLDFKAMQEGVDGLLGRGKFLEYSEVHFSEVFEFAGWSTEVYAKFFERCSSKALFWPYNPDDGVSFEQWLAISFGEFLWFEMPELTEGLSSVREWAPTLKPFANNVLVSPPSYPTLYGRQIVDHKVIKGQSYWKR